MWNERHGASLRAALRILFPLLLLGLAPLAASATDEEGCLFCHRYSLVSGATEEGRSLKVSDPQDAFHAALYCSDCHGDARTAPHPVRPGATSCNAPCHAAAAPPDSHRRASWGGLTEVHRAISQPVPPCLLCHQGEDHKGERGAIAARCARCHPGQFATIRAGVHSHLASRGGAGPCGSCHPAHSQEGPAAAATQGPPVPLQRCTGSGCHGQVTPAMRSLGGHRAAVPAGRGAAAALLATAILTGLLPAFIFPSRRVGAPSTPGKWVTAPPRITRYTLAQRIQHLGAAFLFLLLVASAAARAVNPALASHRVHVLAGLSAAVLLLLHLGYLVIKAVRHDLPLNEVAFLPFADPGEGTGKFSRSERGDYLALLLLALVLCVTGILLRWPGTAGLAPGAYGYARILHLFLGLAAAVMVLGAHARLRLLGEGGDGSALSVLTGSVPLATAEERPGWIRQLVASGILVPVPEERKESEESREGALVRHLLEEGNRLARESDFTGARGRFEEALRLYPDYAQARFNLAVACMKQGDRAEAERQFTAFLAADPFNPMAERAREYIETCREGRTP